MLNIIMYAVLNIHSELSSNFIENVCIGKSKLLLPLVPIFKELYRKKIGQSFIFGYRK